MKHKKLIISLTAVFSVIIFLAIFIIIWYFGSSYKDFGNSYKDFNITGSDSQGSSGSFNKEFKIPGLEEGAMPQGMGAYSSSYDELNEEGKTVSITKQFFFISAYMVDNSASRIYVIDEDNNYIGYVTLKDEDGNDFKGHCGGVATNGITLWVTGESKVYVAKASTEYAAAKKNITQEIVAKAMLSLNNKDGSDISVQFTTSFAANCNASFCFYYDDPSSSSLTYDRLYVGEFYRKGNYETAKTHRVTTPAGYENTAFMYEYNVSTTTDYGLTVLSGDGVTDENKVPKIQKIFSLPELIQGIAFSGRSSYSAKDGVLVLSQSYGLADSHLLCFDYEKLIATTNKSKYTDISGESFAYEGVVKTTDAGSTIAYTDTTLEVYYVDKADKEMLVNDYVIPCMSEGLCVVTNTTTGNIASRKVYVLFESGGQKYKNFVRTPLENVYSFYPRNN